MNLHNYIGIGEFFGAITAIITGVIAIYKLIVRPVYYHFKQISKLISNVDCLVADLKPNGGSSLKDQINRIENRLIRGEMRSRALIRDYECGIFECDMNGNNIYVNRTYCKMINVPSSKLLGKEWLNFIHPIHKNHYEVVWSEHFENCEEIEVDIIMINSNEDAIPVKIKAYPLKDDTQTRCVGYFGMIFSNPDEM